MGLSCSDTCDLLMHKLLAVGFPIDPHTEGQDDLYAALEQCTVLPLDSKAVIGVKAGAAFLIESPIRVELRDFDVIDDAVPNIHYDDDGDPYIYSVL